MLSDKTEEKAINEYKTRSIESISHNLRNPLHGIIALLESSIQLIVSKSLQQYKNVP